MEVEDLVVEDWVVQKKMLEDRVVEKGVGYTYVYLYQVCNPDKSHRALKTRRCSRSDPDSLKNYIG